MWLWFRSSKKAINIAQKYDCTFATCAISPNDIPQSEEELWKELEEIKKIAKQKKVVAIGEIGLDYYWNKDNKELQKKAFIKQIEIANDLNLPIAIHTRDAVMDTLEILKQNNVNNKGIFHCCPLNRELVKEGLKLGFYISFSGVVTFKNAKNANEIIEMVPLDKLLIETDSPYLAPEPVRGTKNTPANVKYVAKKIAEVKKMKLEEIANITYENANNVYKIKKITWTIFKFIVHVTFLLIYFPKSTFTFFLVSSLSTVNKSFGSKWNIDAIIFVGNNWSFVLYIVTVSL